MRKIYLILILFALNNIIKAQPSSVLGSGETWQQIWGDEFSGTTLNTDLWKVYNNNDHYAQLAVSLAKNVSVSGGYLKLTTMREDYTCPIPASEWDCKSQWLAGDNYTYHYTSGYVETNRNKNSKYGYIESMIHLPWQYGLFPAFWVYQADGIPNLHNAAEIDIFEELGSWNSNTISTNVHLQYCPGGSPQCSDNLGSYCPGIPCNGQMINLSNDIWVSTKYGLYWSPSVIYWYVNDFLVRAFPNPGVIDPVRIILNLVVDSWNPPNSTTVFPSTMFVDYVRVYGINTCLNNQTLNAGQSINIANRSNINVTCDNSNFIVNGNGTTGGNLTLNAQKSIRFNPGFSVNPGGFLSATLDDINNAPPLTYSPGGSSNHAETINKEISRGSSSNQAESNIAKANDVKTITTINNSIRISPNPFENTTTINYSLTNQSNVKICIYDVMNKKVAELVNETKQSGEYQFIFNGSNLEKGIYFCTIETDSFKKTEKIVLVK
ncbi:MAG: family 16 glycosylhydrolase [Bacteroidales bacterium]|jgi:beta-glucanase (GH16 family)